MLPAPPSAGSNSFAETTNALTERRARLCATRGRFRLDRGLEVHTALRIFFQQHLMIFYFLTKPAGLGHFCFDLGADWLFVRLGGVAARRRA